MHQDGSLNIEIIKPYGQFLKSNKVEGAFMNGSTGAFKERPDLNQGSQNILLGVDEKLVSCLPLGTNSWVGSTYTHLAPLISSLKDGDTPKAERLQEKAVL